MKMQYKIVAHNPNSTGGYKSSINKSNREVFWVTKSGEDEAGCLRELNKTLLELAKYSGMEYIIEDREVLNG